MDAHTWHWFALYHQPWQARPCQLEKASECPKIDYQSPMVRFHLINYHRCFLSATNHEEDQPAHLTLKDANVPIEVNLAEYDEPAQRYCPAGVYEIVGEEEGSPRPN